MHQLLFSLLLIFLPTQLGLHFWPDWAFVLGRRLDYLSPTLYLTDILIVLLLIMWLSEKRIRFRMPSPKIFIFLGFISVNVYFAAHRMVAIFAWIKILEMIALGFYIIRTKPKIVEIIFPLTIGVLYSSVIAIVQFLLQHSVGGPLWFLGERTFSMGTPGIARVDFTSFFKLRAYATFPHPNVLGGFLAIILPVIMYHLTKTKKIFYMATIVLGIIALASTFSRSAWVVFLVSILYLIFRKKKRAFFPILLCAFLIIFFIGKTFGFQDEAVVVRQQLNAAAISMGTASPLIGTGLGNFLVRLPDYLVSRSVYFLQPAHNIFLLVFSETGIIGFAVFLFVLWKAVQRNILMVPVLLLGLTDHYFMTLQQGQLLFTVILSLSLIQ